MCEISQHNTVIPAHAGIQQQSLMKQQYTECTEALGSMDTGLRRYDEFSVLCSDEPLLSTIGMMDSHSNAWSRNIARAMDLHRSESSLNTVRAVDSHSSKSSLHTVIPAHAGIQQRGLTNLRYTECTEALGSMDTGLRRYDEFSVLCSDEPLLSTIGMMDSHSKTWSRNTARTMDLHRSESSLNTVRAVDSHSSKSSLHTVIPANAGIQQRNSISTEIQQPNSNQRGRH